MGPLTKTLDEGGNVKYLGLILFPLLFVIGCQSNVKVYDAPISLEMLEGKWSWSDAKELCVSRWHKISIINNGEHLKFESHSPFEAVDGKTRKTYSYQVLESIPGGYHLKLNHETRKNHFGNIITWRLLFLDENRYVWQRSDWKQSKISPPVVRCNNHLTN